MKKFLNKLPNALKLLFLKCQTKPNLQPPIKTTEEALEYKKLLQSYNPNVEYLMTLYLTPELTKEEIYKAAKAGIVGKV